MPDLNVGDIVHWFDPEYETIDHNTRGVVLEIQESECQVLWNDEGIPFWEDSNNLWLAETETPGTTPRPASFKTWIKQVDSNGKEGVL